jgi:hypothetical protein
VQSFGKRRAPVLALAHPDSGLVSAAQMGLHRLIVHRGYTRNAGHVLLRQIQNCGRDIGGCTWRSGTDPTCPSRFSHHQKPPVTYQVRASSGNAKYTYSYNVTLSTKGHGHTHPFSGPHLQDDVLAGVQRADGADRRPPKRQAQLGVPAAEGAWTGVDAQRCCRNSGHPAWVGR